MRFSLIFTLAALLPAPSAFAQFSVAYSGDIHSLTLTLNTQSGSNTDPVFTGAPYSGRSISQIIQTSADGTKSAPAISTATMTYRDSKGRMRVERTALGTGGPGAPPAFTIIEIQDAVAGYQYVLDPGKRIAHRAHFQSRAMPVPTRGSTSGITCTDSELTLQDGTERTIKCLGPKVISGADTVGRKITEHHPAIGKQSASIAISESWVDPRTGVVIRTSADNSGVATTTTVDQYKTSEPDAALFAVPAGYKVVDETGRFAIVIPKT